MSDRVVTCVYCGHKYEDGTPESQDKRLTDHIKVCPKHPMREAEAKILELQNDIGTLLRIINIDRVGYDIRDNGTDEEMCLFNEITQRYEELI
jgi:hypothetical protein